MQRQGQHQEDTTVVEEQNNDGPQSCKHGSVVGAWSDEAPTRNENWNTIGGEDGTEVSTAQLQLPSPSRNAIVVVEDTVLSPMALARVDIPTSSSPRNVAVVEFLDIIVANVALESEEGPFTMVISKSAGKSPKKEKKDKQGVTIDKTEGHEGSHRPAQMVAAAVSHALVAKVEEVSGRPSGNDVDVVTFGPSESSQLSRLLFPMVLAMVADWFWPLGGAFEQMEGMPQAMGNDLTYCMWRRTFSGSMRIGKKYHKGSLRFRLAAICGKGHALKGVVIMVTLTSWEHNSLAMSTIGIK
ncbi:hypothetical protein NE237_000044 [Protea cynaroides]|uniref:Uncharacterized protein n=1 Tax=Protea cynaroides TaxID=273540 RepID=A0A9Q0JTS0_9MAGN|nr:hypothetical protein NE237_000044 [Protea cynaroides]